MNDHPHLLVPLCLIRSALCPLLFRAQSIAAAAEFQNVVRQIPTIAELEIGAPLRFESLFPYSDRNRNRKTGCQIVTASLGLSGEDVDALFGLATFAKHLDQQEGIGQDGIIHITTHALARIAGLPCGGGSDVRRTQSRILRLSHVKLTNTAVWHSGTKRFETLSNAELFSIRDMKLLTEPWQPIALELSRTFLTMLRETPCIAVDRNAYRSLKRPAKRRFFLIVHREGWHQAESPIYDADAFTVHQLGYSRFDADPKREARRAKDRLHSLRTLLREFEARDLVRPPRSGSYLSTATTGPLGGRLCLRWKRGPAVITQRQRSVAPALALRDDPLFEQVQALRDQDGNPMAAAALRKILARYGRARVQKHLNVVLMQQRLHPGSVRKSLVATLVDRIQHDHPFPAWYTPAVTAARFTDTALQPAIQARYQQLIHTL